MCEFTTEKTIKKHSWINDDSEYEYIIDETENYFIIKEIPFASHVCRWRGWGNSPDGKCVQGYHSVGEALENDSCYYCSHGISITEYIVPKYILKNSAYRAYILDICEEITSGD